MSATPITECGGWPTPEYTQRITFEGSECAVMAPEDYEALYNSHRTLERRIHALEEALREFVRIDKESGLSSNDEWDLSPALDAARALLHDSTEESLR